MNEVTRCAIRSVLDKMSAAYDNDQWSSRRRKLSREEVVAIRRRYKVSNTQALATEFGVSRSTIQGVALGHLYAEVQVQ